MPKWHRENHCYSCHNNGDAARALLVAARTGLAERTPLAGTLAFLAAPDSWDASGPDGPFKDKKLARIQFAAALAEAEQTGWITDRKARDAAARLVAEMQEPDGSWRTDAPGIVGSPATYGQTLATYMAMRALRDCAGQEASLDKARQWFERHEPKSVLDAAATLLALANDSSDAAARQRGRSLELVKRGESTDGGWGPFVSSPPEVFDTALVVLAFTAQSDRDRFAKWIARGRDYLRATQLADGSWPATTRPPGADSYAQRLSTTGWATLALLAK